MTRLHYSVLGFGIVFILTGGIFLAAQPRPVDKIKGSSTASASPDTFTVRGQTQCILKRKGILAPAVLHPVTEVLVSVGDTVKKGQPLVQLDDDEPQADVRVKKANLESAGIAKREARRYLDSLEQLHTQGAISEQRIHEARASANKTEADERAAKAAVDAVMAELEHYIVDAPIDGVINRLEVYAGMVSRPGTTIWGEILDIAELDVRCQLTVQQADLVKIGDEVEVQVLDSAKSHGTGRLIFIGLEANPEKGTIPALIRLANPGCRLRCEVPVQIRFYHVHHNP